MSTETTVGDVGEQGLWAGAHLIQEAPWSNDHYLLVVDDHPEAAMRPLDMAAGLLRLATMPAVELLRWPLMLLRPRAGAPR